MITGALALSAGAAVAEPVCTLEGGQEFAEMEAAKAQFLTGDFDGFLQTMQQDLGSNVDALREPLQNLAGFVPDGFESCRTIAQRVDTGGMVQEVTTFNIDGESFPFSVYLLAFPGSDRMRFGYVNFNTGIWSVVESLR